LSTGSVKSPNFKKYCEFGALSNFDEARKGKIYEVPVRERAQPRGILKNSEDRRSPDKIPEKLLQREYQSYDNKLNQHESFIKQ
jgi:hypothetical protein